MSVDDPTEERVYMVSGKDAAGDMELFATSDLGRAEARYRAMLSRLKDVKRNYDWTGTDE